MPTAAGRLPIPSAVLPIPQAATNSSFVNYYPPCRPSRAGFLAGRGSSSKFGVLGEMENEAAKIRKLRCFLLFSMASSSSSPASFAGSLLQLLQSSYATAAYLCIALEIELQFWSNCETSAVIKKVNHEPLIN